MKLLMLIPAAYLVIVVTWVFYIAAMGLIPRLRAGTLPRLVRPIAYTAVLLGVLLDALINLLFSLLLVDLPREWLLTGKLKRLKAAGGWRGKVAAWVCSDCLNPFDTTGEHC